MVSVVDAANFLPLLHSGKDLSNLGLAVDEQDQRTLADFLIDRVEFADVIILNKTERLDQEKVVELKALIRFTRDAWPIYFKTLSPACFGPRGFSGWLPGTI